MTEQKIPEILTAASKEKFRQQLLIVSRCMALGLILVVAYAGYSYTQLYKFHQDKSFCYLCGYYEGKRCDQQYLQPHDYRTRDEIIKDIAEYNDKKWPSTRVTGGQYGDSLNSFYNFSNFTLLNATG